MVYILQASRYNSIDGPVSEIVEYAMSEETVAYELIGRRIKALREKMNLTQESLAESIGLSRASLANYESGKQAIQISVLYKVAKILKAEICDILPSLEEVRTANAPEQRIDQDENLKADKRSELKEFIRSINKEEI